MNIVIWWLYVDHMAIVIYIYTIWLFNSSPWKTQKYMEVSSWENHLQMGHLYHGELLNNQMAIVIPGGVKGRCCGNPLDMALLNFHGTFFTIYVPSGNLWDLIVI